MGCSSGPMLSFEKPLPLVSGVCSSQLGSSGGSGSGHRMVASAALVTYGVRSTAVAVSGMPRCSQRTWTVTRPGGGKGHSHNVQV